VLLCERIQLIEQCGSGHGGRDATLLIAPGAAHHHGLAFCQDSDPLARVTKGHAGGHLVQNRSPWQVGQRRFPPRLRITPKPSHGQHRRVFRQAAQSEGAELGLDREHEGRGRSTLGGTSDVEPHALATGCGPGTPGVGVQLQELDTPAAGRLIVTRAKGRQLAAVVAEFHPDAVGSGGDGEALLTSGMLQSVRDEFARQQDSSVAGVFG
jgi:hypothetical protein